MSSDALKADLDDYAYDAGHQPKMAPGDLWGYPFRGCTCGAVTDQSLYEHTVLVGATLFCEERGLPDAAVDIVVRLVMNEGLNCELNELETAVLGLLA
ncbi:hypothetical protein [uncultured Friedmanniella sp.]|uniref:hypothetical protein n=1 Tax=uncultured Friedmanniella sp. TaxID=335381 RepID=UPI0035CAB522